VWFCTQDGDGSTRRENITDWALNEFRTHYGDANITKWDIFHYVYAVLHHPEYRERYVANLKRELPRIPFVMATADPSARAEALGRDDNLENGDDNRGPPLGRLRRPELKLRTTEPSVGMTRRRGTAGAGPKPSVGMTIWGSAARVELAPSTSSGQAFRPASTVLLLWKEPGFSPAAPREARRATQS
jgi:hypothetical protein